MKLIKQIDVHLYKEESGNSPIGRWLDKFSDKDSKIIGRDIKKIQMNWLVDNLLVKPLGNKMWEIRSKLDNRIARIIFVFYEGNIVLLHGFIKKTQKTPQQEMDLARERFKSL
jgi:phage-related protein